MANYPQELAQDAVCQSHTGHMTWLWILPTRPLRLNTNEWMNIHTTHSDTSSEHLNDDGRNYSNNPRVEDDKKKAFRTCLHIHRQTFNIERILWSVRAEGNHFQHLIYIRRVKTATECNKTRGPALTGKWNSGDRCDAWTWCQKIKLHKHIVQAKSSVFEAGGSLHVTSTILQSSNQYTFLAKGHNTQQHLLY